MFLILPQLPDKTSRAVSLDIKADGSTQVLTISNYQEQYSMYKPVRRPAGRQDTVLSQEAFEAVEQQATPTLTVSLSLEGIGLSLINRSIIEVVYLSARGLKVEYINSDVSQSVDLSIGHLQIDNQLPEATFNVVFQPTPINRQGVPKLPTVHASVIILNDRCKPSDVSRTFSNLKHSVRCLVY
jgi:vacuolar protein sorting-associated protein 13A/C